ncbi:MAG TPA: hypothetical protein VH250_00885 [Granulicella sp.]|jgi:type II secretory pathway pseudopilin PulG|nr:hypothetical protein [Granulicella sp.]
MSIEMLTGIVIIFAVLVAAFLGAFVADRRRRRRLHAEQVARQQQQQPEPTRAKAA